MFGDKAHRGAAARAALTCDHPCEQQIGVKTREAGDALGR
jgi:hypothetical protein